MEWSFGGQYGDKDVMCKLIINQTTVAREAGVANGLDGR
jgi:hypothetical protein